MERLTIGQLAKRSGTPAKTIRYYDEAGVLKPSSLSDAGYRLYSATDAERLDSIRALRRLGFPLATIRKMLAGQRGSRDIVEIQLQAVSDHMRALRRQAAILQWALAQDGVDPVHALHLSHAAATLGAAERASKVEAFMQRAAGRNSDDASARRLRELVLNDLPEDLSAEQLEAWLALSSLLDDNELLRTIERQQAPFKKPIEDRAAFGEEVMRILHEATKLAEEACASSDVQVQRLAQRWCTLFARALGKPDDARFRRWFKRYAAQTNDPRIERFWQLVSVLHGRQPYSGFTRAQALLIAAL